MGTKVSYVEREDVGSLDQDAGHGGGAWCQTPGGRRHAVADSKDAKEPEGLIASARIPLFKALLGAPIAFTMSPRGEPSGVRVPDQVMGDLHAQFTGLSLIERQTIKLMRERGLCGLVALGALGDALGAVVAEDLIGDPRGDHSRLPEQHRLGSV